MHQRKRMQDEHKELSTPLLQKYLLISNINNHLTNDFETAYQESVVHRHPIPPPPVPGPQAENV